MSLYNQTTVKAIFLSLHIVFIKNVSFFWKTTYILNFAFRIEIFFLDYFDVKKSNK